MIASALRFWEKHKPEHTTCDFLCLRTKSQSENQLKQMLCLHNKTNLSCLFHFSHVSNMPLNRSNLRSKGFSHLNPNVGINSTRKCLTSEIQAYRNMLFSCAIENSIFFSVKTQSITDSIFLISDVDIALNRSILRSKGFSVLSNT